MIWYIFNWNCWGDKMKAKAAIYCRLSKEDIGKCEQVKESESIINQTMMLLDFAKQQGFELYEVYKDDDYSGLYDDRPGFEKLIEDAKNGKFQIVIAKTQSRFTRNMEHLEKYLHHDFPLWGVRFMGMVDNSDTANKGNKKARQINGLVNEWYCEDLSENIRASYKIKQKNGQFLGSSTPYGYIKDPDDRHRLIPDPYSAEVVKKIFNMYLLGIGKSKIAQILTDDKILIPTEYKRQVLKVNYHNPHETGKTTKWSDQTINKFLHNEVYIGNLIQNKCRTLSYKDKKKVTLPESEWIKVEGTHEAIIDKDIFNRVQNELKARTRDINIGNKKSMFASIMYCGDCGTRMTPSYSKYNKFGKRSRHYLCGQYKKYGNRYCTNHLINEKELSEIVLNDIKKQANLLLDNRIKERLCRMKISSEKKFNEEKTKMLEAEFAKVRRYKEKAFENYADNIIGKDDYIMLKRKYEIKASNLMNELEAFKDEETSRVSDLDSWIDKFIDNINVDELTREIVLCFVNKIVVYEGGKIELNYNFSFMPVRKTEV